MRKTHLFIALLSMGWTVKAQDSLKTVQLDEVFVTGTKSVIPVEKSGKSIYKITRKDINASGVRSVSELLNQAPGIQMDGNFGPLGTNIDYFVRGASSKRTLVLIDGVPFNDPSGIDQTYDLRLLDLSQVESIEILKGGLSTLYGTGAAAGVINITLKKPENDPLNAQAEVSYGSFNTFNSNASVNGSADKFTYLLNAGYTTSDGFSAALDESGNGDFDDDGYDGYNILAKVGYQISDAFSIDLTGSLDEFNSDFDDGAFTDASNNTSEYTQQRIGLSPTYKWSGGGVKGNFFFNKIERVFESSFPSTFEGNNFQGDVLVDQNLSDQIKFIGGLNYQSLAFSQPDVDEESFTMLDPYATFIYEESGYNFQIGGRLSVHSDYGENFVFNLSQSKEFNLSDQFNTRFIASYATAFIAPSLTQLFGAFGPNPDLEPEESQSAEGGFTLYGDDFEFGGVYFYREDENLIIFTDQYNNSEGRIETDGLELQGSWDIRSNVSLNGHYTYTRRLNNDVAFRIPDHKFGASIGYGPVEDLNLTLSYLHTGDRPLQYFDNNTFEVVQLNGDAFDLFDLNASYTIQNVTISGAINNLFDEEYQAIAGFNSVSRNYRIAVRYQFD